MCFVPFCEKEGGGIQVILLQGELLFRTEQANVRVRLDYQVQPLL